MDLNITLTQREREIILDAIVAWENEGCYNSTSRDIRDDDFHGLLTKLNADKSIDRALVYPSHRRPGHTSKSPSP